MEVGQTILDVRWLLTRLTKAPRIVSEAPPSCYVPSADFSSVKYGLFSPELQVASGVARRSVQVLGNGYNNIIIIIIDAEHQYDHVPRAVETSHEGKVTILWNQQNHP